MSGRGLMRRPRPRSRALSPGRRPDQAAATRAGL